MNNTDIKLPSGPSFTQLIDLASERLGGAALSTSDDFFAPKENLLKPQAAIFIPEKFTENGKWMDGWESRRKRGIDNQSHDWCVIRLGVPGVVHGVNIDTSHFTGNFPEEASIDACFLSEEWGTTHFADEKLPWTTILPRSPLKGGSFNFFDINEKLLLSHLKLKIYPDGGVARFRVYGEVKPPWEKLIPELSAKGQTIDLALAKYGGVVISCNDNFFGPKDNLIMPGRSENMGDGWETRRKRGIDDNSHDWIIVKLGHPGKIEFLEVDTNHFKGNFPDSCSVEACSASADPGKAKWTEILPRTKLQAHHQHYFESQLVNKNEIYGYVRLKIFPDGGISRLRVHGHPAVGSN